MVPNAKAWSEASSFPDTEVTFVPDRRSITVTWKATMDAEKATPMREVVRKISLRRFSQDNVTQLYVLEDFNSTSQGQVIKYTELG